MNTICIGAGIVVCQRILLAFVAMKPLATSAEDPATEHAQIRINTSRKMMPATSHVNIIVAAAATSAETSALTSTDRRTTTVRVVAPHSTTTPPINTAACHQKITATILGLIVIVTLSCQGAQLDKLLIKQNPVMENVLITTFFIMMMQVTPPAFTIILAVAAATSAGTSVLGITGTVPAEI